MRFTMNGERSYKIQGPDDTVFRFRKTPDGRFVQDDRIGNNLPKKDEAGWLAAEDLLRRLGRGNI